MNELTTTQRTNRSEMIRVLQNSLYPSAKPESIELVLAYCRANNLDPMLKAVHIVPMWDEESRTMRDVLMPGIADYRIKAARSGEYGGKSEPEFGPDVTRKMGTREITFPAWCRMTVRRIVAGQAREFTATERWLENYATGKDQLTPNKTWTRRPYGQLAKCAEAQVLRMAFPEFSGGTPTAEEMEGKSFEGTTIEGAPQRQAPSRDTLADSIPETEIEEMPAPEPEPARSREELHDFVEWLVKENAAAKSEMRLTGVVNSPKVKQLMHDLTAGGHTDLLKVLNESIQFHAERLHREREAAA